jgi:hypothetical protein
MLVRLQHDGSEDLTAMLPVTPADIEIYKGYGNFTPRGLRGATGHVGVTGYQGVTGWSGVIGVGGETGALGFTGILGCWVQGVTGPKGLPGETIPAYQSSSSTYTQDVIDDSIDAWLDSSDDTLPTIQDTV